MKPGDRQPAYFLIHGHPFWIVEPNDKDLQYLVSLAQKILASNNKPKALLVVSAHYETTGGVRVSADAHHSLLYDYYGFPKHFYDVKYPARGDPALAARVVELVKEAGFSAQTETGRGLDHGVLPMLMHMFPRCEFPVLQLSLPVTKNPNDYFSLGSALAPLRDEGVLIAGTGSVTHNLYEMRRTGFGAAKGVAPWAQEFEGVVRRAVLETRTAEERRRALLETFKAPSYKMACPTVEHYAPVLVAAGAGLEDRPVLTYEGWDSRTLTFAQDCFRFGSNF
ncbi:4,5-DOPA dioxygenase extradiol [Zopfochytrium polystomum]|nr:4,5-DOPA dioxygenase extradiol [Zopfochytrium polystomum]